jgi:hypothetical protein
LREVILRNILWVSVRSAVRGSIGRLIHHAMVGAESQMTRTGSARGRWAGCPMNSRIHVANAKTGAIHMVL